MSFYDAVNLSEGNANRITRAATSYILNIKQKGKGHNLVTFDERERAKVFAMVSLVDYTFDACRAVFEPFYNTFSANTQKIYQSQLCNINTRVLQSTILTMRMAQSEAIAQHLIENDAARAEFEELLAKECNSFFQVRNTPAEYLDDIFRFLEKTVKLKKSTKQKDGCYVYDHDVKNSVLIRYVVAFYLCEDKELLAKQQEFILPLIQYDNTAYDMLLERPVKTFYDCIAQKLNADDVQHAKEDAMFTKYRRRCIKKIAEWLGDNVAPHICMDEDGFDELEACEGEDGVTDARVEEILNFSYIYDVFDELIHGAFHQANAFATDNDDSSTEAHPLLPLVNAIAEAKWITEKKLYQKFAHPILMATCVEILSATAFSEFDGDPKKELKKETLIRRAMPTDIKALTINLFASYLINILAYEAKTKDIDFFLEYAANDQEARKVLFSAARENDRKTDTKKDNGEAKTKEGPSEEDLIAAALKEREKIHSRRVSSLNSTIDKLTREAGSFDKVIEDKAREISELRARIKENEDIISGYEDILSNRAAHKETEEIKDIFGQRILFVGGRYELINVLRNKFPQAKFVSSEIDPIPDFSKIDRIVYFNGWMNHPMYERVFDRVKGYGKPYTFIQTKNFEQVIQHLKDPTRYGIK